MKDKENPCDVCGETCDNLQTWRVKREPYGLNMLPRFLCSMCLPAYMAGFNAALEIYAVPTEDGRLVVTSGSFVFDIEEVRLED